MPLRRTFWLAAIVPRLHLRYDRTTAEGAHQQRKLETLWRSLVSGVEEAASQVEGNQGVEGGLEESDDLWYTYCGWPLYVLFGSQKTTTFAYPSRAPTDALCTPAAYWIARNTSRGGMQTLGPALSVARRGREEADLPTRQSWLEGCP